MTGPKWVVCPCCRGEGTLDDYGAFTSEHLDEWFGDGPDGLLSALDEEG